VGTIIGRLPRRSAPPISPSPAAPPERCAAGVGGALGLDAGSSTEPSRRWRSAATCESNPFPAGTTCPSRIPRDQTAYSSAEDEVGVATVRAPPPNDPVGERIARRGQPEHALCAGDPGRIGHPERVGCRRGEFALTRSRAGVAAGFFLVEELLQVSRRNASNGTTYGLPTLNASTAGIDHVQWMVNPEKNTAASVSA
jgi:hypothetical protein